MKTAMNLHEVHLCAGSLNDQPVVLTEEMLAQVSGGEGSELPSTPQAIDPTPPAPPPPMFPNW